MVKTVPEVKEIDIGDDCENYNCEKFSICEDNVKGTSCPDFYCCNDCKYQCISCKSCLSDVCRYEPREVKTK